MARIPNWTELTMPRYAVLGDRGSVSALYCKACGTQIASKVAQHLTYSSEYIEAKISCSNGSFHVTNGCDICVHLTLTLPQLQKLMEADAEYDPSVLVGRSPTAVVQLGRGMA